MLYVYIYIHIYAHTRMCHPAYTQQQIFCCVWHMAYGMYTVCSAVYLAQIELAFVGRNESLMLRLVLSLLPCYTIALLHCSYEHSTFTITPILTQSHTYTHTYTYAIPNAYTSCLCLYLYSTDTHTYTVLCYTIPISKIPYTIFNIYYYY